MTRWKMNKSQKRKNLNPVKTVRKNYAGENVKSTPAVITEA